MRNSTSQTQFCTVSLEQKFNAGEKKNEEGSLSVRRDARNFVSDGAWAQEEAFGTPAPWFRQLEADSVFFFHQGFGFVYPARRVAAGNPRDLSSLFKALIQWFVVTLLIASERAMEKVQRPLNLSPEIPGNCK